MMWTDWQTDRGIPIYPLQILLAGGIKIINQFTTRCQRSATLVTHQASSSIAHPWHSRISLFLYKMVFFLVVLSIYVTSAVFQPCGDLEAGDNQFLKIQMASPGIEPRSSCSASQELNHPATAAPQNGGWSYKWYLPTAYIQPSSTAVPAPARCRTYRLRTDSHPVQLYPPPRGVVLTDFVQTAIQYSCTCPRAVLVHLGNGKPLTDCIQTAIKYSCTCPRAVSVHLCDRKPLVQERVITLTLF